MDFQEIIKNIPKITCPSSYAGYESGFVRAHIICKDGFVVSIQASEHHYCSPKNNYGPYEAFELGYPSEHEDLLDNHSEIPGKHDGVFPYVPVNVVEAVINKHGGITSCKIPGID
jgi:hypothetical protein